VRRALILDFDGTMVDTEWPAYEAWLAIYARYGARLALADWTACVGAGHGFDPIAHLRAQLAPGTALDAEAILAERLADKIRRLGDAPLLPGVRARMDEAQSLGWALGIASSSPADWVLGHLDRLGIREAFSVVRTRDDVARTKPDPELFASAGALLRVPARGCVVCEDSVNGVRAARAAGMQVVAVPNRVTAGQNFDEAHHTVDSLADVCLAELPFL